MHKVWKLGELCLGLFESHGVVFKERGSNRSRQTASHPHSCFASPSSFLLTTK